MTDTRPTQGPRKVRITFELDVFTDDDKDPGRAAQMAHDAFIRAIRARDTSLAIDDMTLDVRYADSPLNVPPRAMDWCPGCCAKPGEEHSRLDGAKCRYERCPACGWAYGHELSCAAGKQAAYLQRGVWTGRTSEVDACYEAGVWVRFVEGEGWVPCEEHELGARPDLNTLYVRATWDQQAQRWRRKPGDKPRNGAGQDRCVAKHHGVGTADCPREMHHHDAKCGPLDPWNLAVQFFNNTDREERARLSEIPTARRAIEALLEIALGCPRPDEVWEAKDPADAPHGKVVHVIQTSQPDVHFVENLGRFWTERRNKARLSDFLHRYRKCQ